MLPGPHLVHVLPDIWMISIIMVLVIIAMKDDDLDDLAIEHLFIC